MLGDPMTWKCATILETSFDQLDFVVLGNAEKF